MGGGGGGEWKNGFCANCFLAGQSSVRTFFFVFPDIVFVTFWIANYFLPGSIVQILFFWHLYPRASRWSINVFFQHFVSSHTPWRKVICSIPTQDAPRALIGNYFHVSTMFQKLKVFLQQRYVGNVSDFCDFAIVCDYVWSRLKINVPLFSLSPSVAAHHGLSIYPKKELPFFILFTAGLCSFTALLALLTHQFPEPMANAAKTVGITCLLSFGITHHSSPSMLGFEAITFTKGEQHSVFWS